MEVTSSVKLDGAPEELHLKLLIAASTKEDIKKWLTEYEDITKTSYTIRSSKKVTGKYVLFKQLLQCQHNTRCKRVYEPSVKGNTKNTNCPSKINTTLHAVKKRYQGKDKEKYLLYTEMPCEIDLLVTHNHSTGSSDSLRFRKVSPEVREKLINLFHNGHTPATALKMIKMEIQLQCKDYEMVLADRNRCPDYSYSYNVYITEFKKKYTPIEFNLDGKKFILDKLEKYNLEMGEDCAMAVFNESDYAIW